MPLPSQVTFAAGDKAYLAALNQLVADINAAWLAFQATQAGAFFSATSNSSNTIGTGAKTFTLVETTQRAFALGMLLRAADSAAPSTNYMDGQVTAYDPIARTITIAVTSTTGSGTKTAWTISMNAVSGVLPIASGGTGASDAAGARTALGLGTAATHAHTEYASAAQGTAADAALARAGGTMTGAVAMGTNTISGVKNLTFAAEYDAGDTGAAKTITWTNGQQQKVRVTQNTTITIAAPPAPGHYQLRLVMGPGSPFTVAWSGIVSTRWLGSVSTPTPNTAAAGETIVNLFYDGAAIVQAMSRVGAV